MRWNPKGGERAARFFGGGRMSGFQLFMTAIGLVLILEGIMPFLSPDLLRRYLEQVQTMDDRSVRIAGLVSMLSGLGVVYLFSP